MNKFGLYLTFILLIHSNTEFLFAQNTEIAIEHPGADFVYRNIENSLKIVVENTPCSQLMFNVTNASYKWSGCTLIIEPNDAAISCAIEVMNSSGTIISTRSLFIKEVPNPTPQIGGKGPLDYAIELDAVKGFKGIELVYPALRNYKNFQEWTVLSYQLIIKLSSGIEVQYNIAGNVLDTKSASAINNITEGSQIIVRKILCLNTKGEEVYLPEISLFIE